MGAKNLEKWVFSSKEAMEYLGWKRTKFWDLVQGGHIIGRKDGKWRFDKSELDKYIKKTTQR